MVDGNAIAFANNEFRNIDLGNERRNWRAKQILYGLIVNVGICISMCCGAMAAQLISRFFKRKEVTLDSILKPHIMETAERIKKYDTVVIAQDTTSLNYNSHKSLEGIGDIGSGNLKGLLMHSALAVSLDRTPLGLVACKVWAKEIDAPAGVETPLCWVLLTSLSLTSLEDAIYAIEIYATRWVIEEFHKVLKSGTKIERLQFETTDSLLPAIGMLSVVAWRLLYLTKYAREKPDNPVDEFADKTEVKILESWAMVKMKRKYRPITTISDFILFVALLGGFMGRKCDGHPGVQVVWKGLRRLEDAVEFHGVFQKLNMITLK
jgi:hypothetical protein